MKIDYSSLPRRRREDSSSSFYPRFSEREYERRFKLVKDMMREKDLEVLLIYNSSPSMGTVHYLSNYASGQPTYLLYPLDDQPTLILHFFNHIPCVREMSIIEDVQWHLNDPINSVVQNLKEKNLVTSGIGVVGFNSIPHSQFLGISEGLRDATFVDVSRDYNWIRWVRSEEEIEWFRRSAQLTDLTMRALERGIKPGLSEHDLNAIMHDPPLREGGQFSVSFIASTNMMNPDVFVPWQFPTNRILKTGDIVITEVTVGYYGYSAQIHRPFAVGTEPTSLYKKLFETALTCFDRVSKVLRPGATTKDIIQATSVIEENGFTVYDSLFHGEGAKFPELGTETSIHPKEPFTIKENMQFVIQPQPITKDHKAGLQVGAAVICRGNGAENLHAYPFKFPVCGAT